jgi:UDP:flavonoid glycosyltransferase YjiC (YdhE family)
MRITITTVGSRGDVQPYVALGRGLQQAGHAVTMAVDPIFEAFIRENGLGFAALAADPMKALEADIRALGNNPVKVFRWIAEYVEQIGSEYFETYLAANQGTELMVFSSVAAMAGLHVGAVLDVPMLATTLQPIVPTSGYPYSAGMILPSWFPFLGTINKASYLIFNRMFYRMFYKFINRDRQAVLGLPPLPWRAYASLDLSAYPMLHGFSRHVVPKPADYNDNQIFTGYWFLDQEFTWQPPDSLTDFLSAGPKPVYVGFGSMVDREAEELTEMVVEALRLAGMRGILLGGWTDLGGGGLPENILKIENVPHEWLFPRMAAVVHHGGAGTTAASLRSGTPSVVVPFFADQPFWGWRVARLGAGPDPIPRNKLTPGRLAAAIRQAVTDQTIRRTAAELGEKIRAEVGVGDAVRAVERVMAEQRAVIMPPPELKGT